jgi:ABC-type transport system involved in cytochrome c biogenesis permease subunit
MRKIILAISIALITLESAPAGDSPGADFDWTAWKYLPVQDGGRQKPFDTLARETLRTLTNRSKIADPDSGRPLDAEAFYLSLVFDWQGWGKPEAPPEDATLMTEYFRAHRPDKWDHAPLVWIGSSDLQKMLGVAKKQTHISPSDFPGLKIAGEPSQRPVAFLDWAEQLSMADRKKLSPVEKQGLELAERYWTYLLLRMGQRFYLLPLRDDPHRQWASLAMLAQAELDGKSDPGGEYCQAKDAFLKVREAFRRQDAQAFRDASAAFLATVREAGPKLGEYPAENAIAIEVDYHRWSPFRIAWMLSLAAAAFALLGMILKARPLGWIAWLAFFAGLAAMIAGFTLRSLIAHRAPITNMYESVLSVAAGIAVLGLLYELYWRKRYLLLAASILSTLVLLFAESCPSICDPTIRPLPPVLRSNLLLVVHVVPIMASYAALAVAWILGNVLLGCHLGNRADDELAAMLNRLILKILRIGVFLLTLGTILGGAWADLSWGRFWGWDPKEVWALISLLLYLMILHARKVGWIADFGTAFWSVLAFVAVIMTWYGVNFVLGTGLHTYGSGSGGIGYYVIAGLTAQFAYVCTAAIVKLAKDDGPEKTVNSLD